MISPTLTLVALCIIGYLSGSCLGAVWIMRWRNEPDPRTLGSCNPGASNVYRLAGAPAAILTLIFDAGKGALPVALAQLAGLNTWEQGLVGLCAVLGHMLPAFHRLSGGKGVATALGSCLVLAWQTTLALTLIWALIVWRMRVSSVASISAALLGPPVALLLNPDALPVFLTLSVLLLLRHWRNLIRLARGQELSLTRPPS